MSRATTTSQKSSANFVVKVFTTPADDYSLRLEPQYTFGRHAYSSKQTDIHHIARAYTAPFEWRAANTSGRRPADADAAVRHAGHHQISRGAGNGVLEADSVFSVRTGFVAVGATVGPADLAIRGGVCFRTGNGGDSQGFAASEFRRGNWLGATTGRCVVGFSRPFPSMTRCQP